MVDIKKKNGKKKRANWRQANKAVAAGSNNSYLNSVDFLLFLFLRKKRAKCVCVLWSFFKYL
jgi:hypothetical protein